MNFYSANKWLLNETLFQVWYYNIRDTLLIYTDAKLLAHHQNIPSFFPNYLFELGEAREVGRRFIQNQIQHSKP